jgi:YidC/Oxa1 family membrane protein insertase
MQNASPFFPASRPTLAIPRARLAAGLSSAAQHILNEKALSEWSPDQIANHIPVGDIHKIGDLAEIGLANTWWPSDWFLRLLEFIHVSADLPWWGSIVVLTLMLRVSLFPLMLKTTRNMAVIPHMKDRLEPIMKELKEARSADDIVRSKKSSLQLLELYKEWGYGPFVNFFGLVQLPIFISMFRALYRSAHLPVPGLQTGGILWFTDLTATDPYFILPMISGITTSVTIFVPLQMMGLI